ncbi:thioesterase-like superfamily-domain-containing protein [Durotheca rogersii]|uniref:thioesterase-like superfamily-domain-containing protein n=1 Tax=Durotheca rogersii TaxID=419775 RepID=UPI00221F881F|nr:thioesterase-like superfamily-domain-containing protein [Durotheca rogersii]KAI5862635.1 thioesterase-like superfamily-domain-containing protein [Durotheca rogersii]
MVPTLAEATAVRAIDSHTYAVDFDPEWCVGSVPHGGMVTSAILSATTTHFRTTLAAQNQPHTISLHVDFLRRTQGGPATLTIREVKLGRQTSIVHVALSQNGRDEVVAHATHSNMDVESGLSLHTGWSLHPPPPPLPADFATLATTGASGDANWVEETSRPFAESRKVCNRVRTFLPRGGQVMPGIVDEWLRLESGDKFTNESLGLASDMFPSVITDLWGCGLNGKEGDAPPFWHPTVLLNLDIKRLLPPGGAEWLFVRVRPKCLRNGRMDLEVVILDQAGEVLALSHHVVLVVSPERNLAARRVGQNKI